MLVLQISSQQSYLPLRSWLPIAAAASTRREEKKVQFKDTIIKTLLPLKSHPPPRLTPIYLLFSPCVFVSISFSPFTLSPFLLFLFHSFFLSFILFYLYLYISRCLLYVLSVFPLFLCCSHFIFLSLCLFLPLFLSISYFYLNLCLALPFSHLHSLSLCLSPLSLSLIMTNEFPLSKRKRKFC